MKVNLLSGYLKQVYGHKIYKISLNGGMSCPNRDGKLGTGGCIFCSAGGSGDFAPSPLMSVTNQIEEGKKQIENKYKGSGYIAYFQAYSNTYGDMDYLRKIFTEAISHPQVEILSIATRPDCIDRERAMLIGELNKIKPVWVELGLQTSNEKSAKYIKRGYDNSVFEEAVEMLAKQNVECIVHMIIGLPCETREDMINTVKYINGFNIKGIKFQLLHVLKGTSLAEIYNREKFHIYSLEEYTDILLELIEYLREDIVIHRMTGDGPKKLLIEPLWTGNKRMVLNSINREFSRRNIIQGSKWANVHKQQCF